MVSVFVNRDQHVACETSNIAVRDALDRTILKIEISLRNPKIIVPAWSWVPPKSTSTPSLEPLGPDNHHVIE